MSNTVLIQIYSIIFIDAFAVGVMLPVLTDRFKKAGGTKFHLSLMASMNSFSQLSLRPITNHYRECLGSAITLFTLMLIGLASHVGIRNSETFQTLVTFRIIFYIANQIQAVCSLFVPYLVSDQRYYQTVYSYFYLFQIMGLTLGPIVGTELFLATDDCFECVMNLVIVCTIVNLIMCLFLPCVEQMSPIRTCGGAESSLGAKYFNEFQYIKEKCLKFPIRDYWRLVVIRLMTSISFYMFFAHYTPFLKNRFDVSFHTKGYTMAYQHFVLFISNNLAMIYVKSYIKPNNIKTGLTTALLCQTVVMSFIYRVKIFQLYLILFIPLAFLRMFFENIWNYLCRGDDDVKQPLRFMIRFMDILLPILLSTVLNIELNLIFVYFILCPLIVATILSVDY